MELLKKTIYILLGNFILALGIVAFIIPSGIIVGGGTGIGLVVQHFVGLEVSTTVFIINAIMFVLGLLVLGKTFALATLLSTFVFPTFLAILGDTAFLQNLTSDLLLSAIFAGLLIGLGMGLVLRVGASTGGMDIPPLVVNHFTGISVAILINLFDIIVLALQSMFSSTEQILYGILVVLVTTVVIDKMLLLGETQVQVTIISNKFESIREMIVDDLDRGCTFLNITTGYHRHDQCAVMVVITKREVRKLNDLVLNIDPYAFMISNTTHSVKGRGFTLPSIDEVTR